MVQRMGQPIKDIAGAQPDGRSVAAGMTAEECFVQQVTVYHQLHPIFCVILQTEDGGRAGRQMQQRCQLFLAGERETGAFQLCCDLLGAKGLGCRQKQQIESSFLPVAKKQVLANRRVQRL